MTRCPVCGGALTPWVEKMNRAVYRCASCGHINVPAGVVRRADGLTIYESDDSIFEADGNADYYFDDTNADAAREKLAYVARFAKPGGRLFDVGASYGHFLVEAQKQYEASGIEVSPGATRWAQSTFHVDVSVGSVYDIPSSRAYDAVTFWDVVEHLDDPGAGLDRIRECLKPGGLLFLSTPDAGSLVARLMDARWHYLDPIQHVNLFSRKTLVRLARDRGLSLVHYTYFGRSYRLSYIVNRVAYLLRGPGASSSSASAGSSDAFWNVAIPLKLWDVMGLVLRADR